MEVLSRFSRVAAKGVSIFSALLMALALYAAFAPANAWAASKASVSASECTVIGNYEGTLVEADVNYIVLDEFADTIVFTDVVGKMEDSFSFITCPHNMSYYYTSTEEIAACSSSQFTSEDLQDLIDDEELELKVDASSIDLSNAHAFVMVDDDDDEYFFIIQIPEEAAGIDAGFTPSIGTVGELQSGAYSYTAYVYDPDNPAADSWGYVSVESTADLYTLKVPTGTQTLELSFESALLAYGYDEYGSYLSSGSANPDGYADNGGVGEETATFKADEEGLLPPFIQVQIPYNDANGGTLMYAIKIEYSYTFTASVNGSEITEISFEPEGYSYTGFAYDPENPEADDWGYVYPEYKIALYTLTVPEGVEEVDFVFSDNVITYNYDAYGTCLSEFYSDDVLYSGFTTATIKIDYDSNAAIDFIQIQSPYVGYDSTVLYAITFDDGSSSEPDPDDPSEMDADIEAIKKAAGEKLAETLDSNGSVYGQEWLIMDEARDGKEVSGDYIDSVIAKLEETDGVLNTGAGDYTNYAKTILALTAAGYDATAIKGYDLTEALADVDAVTKQGANGAAYALLALDSGDYADPGDGTRDALIAAILAEEIDGGGWDWMGENPDPDMTAIMIQALAPYADSNDQAKAAIERGIQVLSDMQLDTGGYASWGNENSCSAAQVIIALTAVGIDPTTDERFIKEGNSAVDALCAYALKDGGFGFTTNKTYDALSTRQGFEALLALERFLTKENALYDMTDVNLNGVYDVAEILDAGDTGITAEGTVVLPSGSDPVLLIEPIDKTHPDYAATTAKLSADGVLLGTYSITLFANDEPVHSGFGDINITFPVDAALNGKTVTLHHLHADGSLTSETATVANGAVSFTFKDLSTVALEQTASSENTPQSDSSTASDSSQTPNTSDSTIPVAPLAITAIASLLIALFAWRRKEMTR